MQVDASRAPRGGELTFGDIPDKGSRDCGQLSSGALCSLNIVPLHPNWIAPALSLRFPFFFFSRKGVF
jgi:hypothetical protein